MKRKVGLGKNDFTFTPHFLIQKLSEVDYKVIKLQNVAYIKTSSILNYGYTEFFNKSDESLGEIKNTAYDCRVFNEICKEQLPWAELK